MSKHNNLLIAGFGLFLSSILLLRVMIGSPALARDETYIFLQEHWLGMILAELPSFLFVMLPVIMGMACLAIILYITDLLDLSYLRKNLVALFFVLSPVVITTFTTYNEMMFVSTLALVSIVVHRRLAAIPLLAISIISPLVGVIISSVIAAYFLHEKQLIASSLLIAPVSAGIALFDTATQLSWVGLFGEFASIQGYSLFLLLLGVVALVEHWNKLNITPIVAWFILFLMSAYIVELRVLLVVPLAMYVSESLVTFFKTKWVLDFLQHASVILLTCVALFVLITHSQLLISEYPNNEVSELLFFVEESPRTGSLLTTLEHKGYSNYVLGRNVHSFNDDDMFWELVRLSEAGVVINEYDIRYFLFEQRFREKGFFFLLTTNDKFIQIAQQGDYELWVVLQELVLEEEGQ